MIKSLPMVVLGLNVIIYLTINIIEDCIILVNCIGNTHISYTQCQFFKKFLFRYI